MANKALVLDANILIRAVLGNRVRRIMEAHAETVSLFVPEIAYKDAERHLATLVTKRSGDPAKAIILLRTIADLTELVSPENYALFEADARQRIGARDPDDWPILAAALALGCPIWTEDTDFFGCGVSTWTSTNVELYLTS